MTKTVMVQWLSQATLRFHYANSGSAERGSHVGLSFGFGGVMELGVRARSIRALAPTLHALVCSLMGLRQEEPK